MIARYEDPEIAEIWSDIHRLELWQRTELAVIKAKANLGAIPKAVPDEIFIVLAEENPIDLLWWQQRDQEIKHDLQAFLDERLTQVNY